MVGGLYWFSCQNTASAISWWAGFFFFLIVRQGGQENIILFSRIFSIMKPSPLLVLVVQKITSQWTYCTSPYNGNALRTSMICWCVMMVMRVGFQCYVKKTFFIYPSCQWTNNSKKGKGQIQKTWLYGTIPKVWPSRLETGPRSWLSWIGKRCFRVQKNNVHGIEYKHKASI